jgi:hypothetical protein
MRIDGKVFLLESKDPPIPDEIRNVPELRIKLCGFKHYDALAAFPPIIELHSGTWSIDTLSPLAMLTSLRMLSLVDCRNVRSLSPVAGLVNLEHFSFVTSMGNSRYLVIDSLRPLASLHKLRTIDIRGLKTLDKDLSPLCGLNELRSCSVANLFPQAELARLSRSLPRRIPRVWFLRPYILMGDSHVCECGEMKVMLTGSEIRPQIICPKCQSKKFDACVQRFEELAAAAKREKSAQVRM